MEKLKPNFTQFPNVILDELLSELSDAELKCICYIVRRTYGFQRETDKIALSQFETGLISHNGVRLDYGTGMSKRSIIRALKSLEDRSIIFSDNKYNHKTYGINLNWNNGDKSTLGENGDNISHNGDKSTPIMVTKSNIQKKEKESIQKKDIFSGKPSNNVSEIIKLFESVDAKNKTYYANKGQRMACQFMIGEYGFENVCKVIQLLPNTNQLDYFPRITNPYELKEKWTKLATALQSKKRNEDFSSIML